MLKDEFDSIKLLSANIEQEVSLFSFAFLSHNWSDANRSKSAANRNGSFSSEDMFRRVEALVGEDGKNVLTRETLGAGECMALGGENSASLVNIGVNEPQHVTMEDANGVT